MELVTFKNHVNYLHITCREYNVTLAATKEALALVFSDSEYTEELCEARFSSDEAKTLRKLCDGVLSEGKDVAFIEGGAVDLPMVKVSKSTWGEPYQEAVRIEFSADFDNYDIEPKVFELAIENVTLVLEFLAKNFSE